MVDTALFKYHLVKNKLTLADVAKALSVHYSTVADKINNVHEFKANEIIICSRLMKLSVDDRERIFFNQKGVKNDTSN